MPPANVNYAYLTAYGLSDFQANRCRSSSSSATTTTPRPRPRQGLHPLGWDVDLSGLPATFSPTPAMPFAWPTSPKAAMGLRRRPQRRRSELAVGQDEGAAT